jgi:UDP-2,4-diacetamido-2,4,6-trideoxy-beta-L-altropyranose hydrolase
MTGWQVAVRADASRVLGSGHVMRCLTLAEVLRARGATVQFLCRPAPGHLGDRIAAQGFGLRWLPDSPDGDAAADALQTVAALGPAGCDLLLVDHYALGAAWQQRLHPACRRLAVIDDLADRAHSADLLLDQNLGRQAADYAALLPAAATRLIGPAYALLRPEFAAARAASLARRSAGRLQHLLISMGGADPQQATLRVLQALAPAPLPAGAQVTVVLGAIAETQPVIAALLPHLPWPTRLCVDVADMTPLLQAADIAIGAAGGSAWERCCLGLPSALLVLADNQRPGTQALVAAGAALALGGVDDLPASLPAMLQHAADGPTLQRLSAAAAAVTDGLGAQRVADALLALWQGRA